MPGRLQITRSSDHPINRLRRTAAAVLLASAAKIALPSPSSVEGVVLGIMQEGGLPHAGCHQPVCVAARRDPSRRRHVACLGLIDRKSGKRFLVDATPDFAEQMERLGGLPDAILLTHAHIGHYLGLAQLGREVLGTKGLPLYCTSSMAKFLRENRPWSRLVESGNVTIREIEPDVPFSLTPNLRVTAWRVPHRDEDSDTVAYRIEGPRARILWLPDIDKWEKWDRRLEDVASDPALTVFLDGTFFAADEIPGRSIAEIPHPLVPETVERLSRAGKPGARALFVHLNHTNRLLWDPRALSDLRKRGFSVAREGSRYPL